MAYTLLGDAGALSTAARQPRRAGFDAEQTGQLTLTDCAAVGNEGVGLISFDAGTVVNATGLLVEGGKELAPGSNQVGGGVFVQNGPTGTLARLAVIDDAVDGVVAYGGATLTLTDSLVSGTKPSALFQPGIGGAGIYAIASTLTLSSTRSEDTPPRASRSSRAA